MIRSTCAWLLLLLAASPVTAPFSTCDLRVFVAQTASLEAAAPQFGSLSAAERDGGDAYSISPLVNRSALSQDSPSSVAVLRLHVILPGIVARMSVPLALNRSPHELPASATVLRL
jgi:hypothetical protein